MKIFFPILLGGLIASTSLSNLNSQVEPIRIQSAGYREQGGYGKGETVLQLGDQIRQQAETITNYELPTVNCDNSAGSFNYHLMMNPSVEGAEEAIERLTLSATGPANSLGSNRLGTAVREEITSASSTPHMPPSITDSSNQHIDQPTVYSLQPTTSICSVGRIVSSAQRDDEKCEGLEKTAQITYFLSEASRCLAEVTKRHNSGNKRNLSLWYKSAQYNKAAVDAARSSLDRLEKANEASRIGNNHLSTLWRKTAEQYQSAAEYYSKSAEAYESDCIEDGTEDAMENATEYDRERDCRVMTVFRKKEGWKEGQRFGGDWEGLDSGFEFNSGCGRRALQGAFQLEKAVECFGKAILAEKQENQPLFDFWHKAAEQYEVAAECSSKHAVALAASGHFTGDEKTRQLMCEAHAAWNIAQQLEYAAIALEKAIQAENLSSLSPSAANDFIAPGLEVSSSSCHSNAQEPSIDSLAPARLTPTELLETSSSGLSSDFPATCIPCPSSAAATLKKGSEQNDNQLLADLWRKVVEQNQVAVEYGRKHAENLVFKFAHSYASKKGNACFYETRDAAISSAKHLHKAAIAFEKSCQAEKNGNQPLSSLWRKSFEQNQMAAESYKRDVEAFQDQGSCSVKKSINYIESRADQFREAAISLEQAIKAEESNNQPLATLWLQSSEQWQAASEYMRQALEFYEQVSHDSSDSVLRSEGWSSQYEKASKLLPKVDHFDHLGRSAWSSALQFKKAAELLEKALEVERKGDQSISTLYRKASTFNRASAKYKIKDKEAYLQGSEQVDHNKNTRFYHAVESVENGAHQLEEAAASLEKAIKAEQADNQYLSSLCRKAADLNQVSAEYSKQASDAYAQKNKTEGENLDRTAKSSKQSADEAKMEADLIFFVNDLSDKEDS